MQTNKSMLIFSSFLLKTLSFALIAISFAGTPLHAMEKTPAKAQTASLVAITIAMAITPAEPTPAQKTLAVANQADKNTCSICSKRWPYPSKLAEHMRTHTGEKPYKCKFKGCKYACTNSSNLKTHTLTHTGEKPYKCDAHGCNYACTTSGNLKRHERTHKNKRTAPETLDQVVKRHDAKNTHQCETDTETESEMKIAHENQ